MNSSLIEKLTIVEFASVLAGPLTGTFFAELGAKVIKIENPKTAGDITRSWRAQNEDTRSGISSYYASANYGKQSIFLDISIDEDKEKALALCAKADIVISNYKPSSAVKLGITYDAIKKVNPSVIFAELTGFPKGIDEPAFDILLQARTGYLAMTGWPDQEPAKIPVAMIDILASHQLREGILVALMERMIDGNSRYVTTNLYQAALSGLVNQATDYLMNGNVPAKMGSKHPHIAPYGDMFYTKDKVPFILAIGTDRKFLNLLKVIGLEDLSKEYATNDERVKRRSILIAKLSDKMLSFSSKQLFHKLSSEQIPFSEILTLDQVFEEPNARKLILKEKIEDRECRKTKTVVFSVHQE